MGPYGTLQTPSVPSQLAFRGVNYGTASFDGTCTAAQVDSGLLVLENAGEVRVYCRLTPLNLHFLRNAPTPLAPYVTRNYHHEDRSRVGRPPLPHECGGQSKA
jgi:hypothetical protein